MQVQIRGRILEYPQEEGAAAGGLIGPYRHSPDSGRSATTEPRPQLPDTRLTRIYKACIVTLSFVRACCGTQLSLREFGQTQKVEAYRNRWVGRKPKSPHRIP